MTAAPEIRAFVGAKEVGAIAAAASFAPRAWLLGVAAVQVQLEARGRAAARLRLNLTGWPQAQVVPLDASTDVHLALCTPGDDLAPPHGLGLDREPGIHLRVDGAPQALAPLLLDAWRQDPLPRAFGHVYCRYLRDGGFEAGYDLTRFLSLPPGAKYERLVAAPLFPGQVVTYRLRL